MRLSDSYNAISELRLSVSAAQGPPVKETCEGLGARLYNNFHCLTDAQSPSYLTSSRSPR